MIKGTNADCKIISTTITETTATLTLLIFATKATSPAKSFQLFIKDQDDDIRYLVNNNVYWIDRVNNYNFDSNNIDTNKYKEIIVNIDITKNNLGKIESNRWVRNCQLYLIDETNSSKEIAWSSGNLTLISDEFEIPEIINVVFRPVNVRVNVVEPTNPHPEFNIEAEFKLKYTSEKDFNYNNKNFIARLNIRSLSTDAIIDTKDLTSSSVNLVNTITSNKYFNYREPILMEIIIANKNGDIFYTKRRVYNPIKKYSNTYIKTEQGIRRVAAYFVNKKVEGLGE